MLACKCFTGLETRPSNEKKKQDRVMRFSNGGRIVGAGTAEQSVNKGNDYKKGDNLSWRKNH